MTQLINEEDRQLNLFIDEYERRRDEKLAKTIDYLQNKYGKGIVSKAISYTDAGTKHGRLGLMAGINVKYILLSMKCAFKRNRAHFIVLVIIECMFQNH